jgi:hypothetical protein
LSNFSLLLQLIKQPERLRSLLSFNSKGYLDTIGWFKAFDSKAPVDAHNNPIPWVTYSFIDFIKDRLKPEHAVFEFGSGNSTTFYAQRTGIVVSVEHDQEWFEKITKAKPDNAEIIFCELQRDGDYCRMPVKLGEALISSSLTAATGLTAACMLLRLCLTMALLCLTILKDRTTAMGSVICLIKDLSRYRLVAYRRACSTINPLRYFTRLITV